MTVRAAAFRGVPGAAAKSQARLCFRAGKDGAGLEAAG